VNEEPFWQNNASYNSIEPSSTQIDPRKHCSDEVKETEEPKPSKPNFSKHLAPSDIPISIPISIS
jgi:hypothetical protein